ncbi:MAG: gliding motility-associated C-terminal domain-containing protein [Crocinitomicaceae bacterium]
MRKLLYITPLISLFFCTVSWGKVIPVVNNSDAGTGSLREAINSAASFDTILIDVSGVIELESPIVIDGLNGLTIIGPYAMHNTISAVGTWSGYSSLLIIQNSAGIRLENLGFKGTITNVRAIDVLSSSGAAGAPIKIDRCMFESFVQSSIIGGAIISAGIEVQILRSSFIDNSATRGGGIYLDGTGSTRIINCTFWGNQSNNEGGAIFIQNSGTTNLTHNTFFENNSVMDVGEVVFVTGLLQVNVQNNAGAGNGTTDQFVEATAGSFNSDGGNIIKLNYLSEPIPWSGTGDVNSTLVISGLRSTILKDGYGLKYFTITDPTSSFIDAGVSTALPPTDQRMAPRVLYGGNLPGVPDAGACEFTLLRVENNSGNVITGSLATALSSASDPMNYIEFDIPGTGPHQIDAASNLASNYPVIIDGFSQTGSQIPGPESTGNPGLTKAVLPISLNGGNGATQGIIFGSGTDQSRISGIRITNFEIGILINNTSDIQVQGCELGIDGTGNVMSNIYTGLNIQSANNCLIGGEQHWKRNVFSGNGGVNWNSNISIASIADHTVIKGNIIGLAGNGLDPVSPAPPSGSVGIWLAGTNHKIGGKGHLEKNVISGSPFAGILYLGSSALIIHNYIGLDAEGVNAIPGDFGIRLDNSSQSVTIGGTEGVKTRNIIAGHNLANISIVETQFSQIIGNYIGTDKTSTVSFPSTQDGIIIQGTSISDLSIGGTVDSSGNVISGHQNGIKILECGSGIVINSNKIGTDVSGTNAIPNSDNGIVIESLNALPLIIGTPGNGNLISGNTTGTGVFINSSAGHNLYGNHIGIAADGSSPLANEDGIEIHGCSDIKIGGDVSLAEGNIISSNSNNGIYVANNSLNTSIWGNIIGADTTGNLPLGNGLNGILVENSDNTTIGGALEFRNVIADHTTVGSAGIFCDFNGNTTILGNKIGTNVDGTAPLGNETGIKVSGTQDVTIGAPAEENYICANTHAGIEVVGGNVTIESAFVGVGVSNTLLGMGNKDGIIVETKNVVIGSVSGGQTVIANNNDNGIFLSGDQADSCQIGNCYIGLITSGDPAGNGIHGIKIEEGDHNLIGFGTNYIGANTGDAIHLINGANQNQIIRNYIGNVNGVAGTENDRGIAVLSNSVGNEIGNLNVGDGNTIGGNLSYGVALIEADSNKMMGNYVGTDGGNGVWPNDVGILIRESHGNVIGKDWVGSGLSNVIANNTNEGILIEQNSEGNIVAANKIGTNTAGNAVASNGSGVKIITGSKFNQLGGSKLLNLGNTISGNNVMGVVLESDSNFVSGNFIGVSSDNLLALGIQDQGIYVSGSQGNIIGGNRDTLGNFIAGNEQAGVLIDNAANTLISGNIIGHVSGNIQPYGIEIKGPSATLNQIGNPPLNTHGNFIFTNLTAGIYIYDGATDNMIQSNVVGVDTNFFEYPNIQAAGVLITATAGAANHIGNNVPDGGNLISGNGNGIVIQADQQEVINNKIGTDLSGTLQIENTANGILLNNGAQNNQIGGAGPLMTNLISGNTLSGVRMEDAGTELNVIAGNIIGISMDSLVAIPNNIGVDLAIGASNNSIGQNVSNGGNTISGNLTFGVFIHDTGTDNNSVYNNYIGLVHPNVHGVVISNNATDNVVGGATPLQSNVISGNDSVGVGINGASNNYIMNNRIGSSIDGLSPIPNYLGVAFFNASTNFIGNPSVGNLISGNTGANIVLDAGSSFNEIQSNKIGTTITGNAVMSGSNTIYGIYCVNGGNNLIGGDETVGEGNIISGHLFNGISLVNENADLVYGNNIGLSQDKTTYLGNALYGVGLSNSTLCKIGDTGSGQGNVITANGFGIRMVYSDDNECLNNFIGNDHQGGLAGVLAGVNNQQAGIIIDTTSSGNFIGEQNIIAGNQLTGVLIRGAGTNENEVSNNYFGVDVNGNLSYSNDSANVVIMEGAKLNLIGGPSVAERNIFGGDAVVHVLIQDPLTDSNAVAGNYIGVGVDGTTTYANDIGIAVIDSASYNQIGGGNSPTEGNYIPNADVFGIYLGDRTSYTKIQGNHIGVKPDGSPGNIDSTGIRLHGSDWNQIGGLLVGSDSANVITNCKTGVDVLQYPFLNSSYGNAIIGNSIYNNQALGIDINADEMVLPIDTNQNLWNNGEIDRPMILTAWNCGGSGNTHVGFEFYSNNALAGYRVAFYSNTSPDPSGYGEGETFLGDWVFDPLTNVDTIAVDLGVSLPVGTSITATITGTALNTSEFSENVTITNPPTFNPPTTVPESCLGAGDGQIEIFAPESYYLSVDNGVSFYYSPEGDTVTVASGTYTIQAQYLNGCVLENTVVLDPGPALQFDTEVISDTCGQAIGMIIIDTTITNDSGGSGTYSFTYDNGLTFTTVDTAYNLTGGVYNVFLIDQALGCYSDTIAVEVASVSPPAPTIITTDSIYCPGDTLLTMSISEQTSQTISWYDNGELLDVAETGTSYIPNDLQTGNNYFYATLTDTAGCVSYPDSINYLLLDVSTMYADTIVEVCIGSEVILNAYGGEAYQWTESNQIISELDQPSVETKILTDENFIVTITDGFGCQTKDTVVVVLLSQDQCQVDVYNAFSPNNDGKNDVWIIDGIEGFGQNRVIVYNRWGDVIISFDNYDNLNVVWDGNNKNGKPMPAGTYFYVVEVGNEQNQAGWVQIVK